MLNRMKSALTTIFTVVLAIVFNSCCKEETILKRFSFTNEGGTIEYSIDIDGSTIFLEEKGDSSQETYYCDDLVSHDGQWFTELEWIRVYYAPANKILIISTDKNSTGQTREAIISAIINNKSTVIAEILQRE